MAASSGVVSNSIDGILRTLAHARTEDDLLTELVFQLQAISGFDACDLLLRDAQENLVLRATTSAPEYNSRVKLGKGIGVSGAATLSGEAIFLPEKAEMHPSFAKCPGIDDHACESMA